MPSSNNNLAPVEVNPKMDNLKQVQTLCRYCWKPELQHIAAEDQAKIRAVELGSDTCVMFETAVHNSLYEQAVVWDRRDVEGESNYSFAKAQPDDLMFVFPREQTEEDRQIKCFQIRVADNAKRMKLEMFHAVKAIAALNQLRPKQTVINFTRMLAESMLPSNSSELLVQAVAKEIYCTALAQNLRKES